jgi:SSS family solute:Na+ symporter
VEIVGKSDVYIENRRVGDSDQEQWERVLVIDGKDKKDPKNTYAFMITELLPPGLTGIMAAALMAALMSTVSGALNSIATLFSFDLYKQWKPQTSNRQLILVGRLVTFIGMTMAIFWSPFVGGFESIFSGIVTMICYLAPPITVVFVMGVFWRRASSLGAQISLYAGSALGLIIFLMDWFKNEPALTFWKNLNIPSLMSAFYLSVICSIILVVVSLWKPEPVTEQKQRLVWNDWREPLRSSGWKGLRDYRILSAILFATMVLLYVLFA